MFEPLSKTVEVRGEPIRVTELSAAQALEFGQRAQDGDTEGFMVDLVAAAIGEEADTVRAWPFAVVKTLFDVAQEISGLGDEDIEGN